MRQCLAKKINENGHENSLKIVYERIYAQFTQMKNKNNNDKKGQKNQ